MALNLFYKVQQMEGPSVNSGKFKMNGEVDSLLSQKVSKNVLQF